MKKIIYMILFMSAWTLTSFAEDQKMLTIGISGTYSGGFAGVGKSVSDGESDYLKWLGAKGGIEYKDPLSGKTEKVGINVIVEDNQYNPEKAKSVYDSFKAKGVNMIIGFGSTPGQACAESASKDHIPYLSWYAYATPIGYKPKPQYYWTLLPTVAESATPMLKWFVKVKWKGAETPKIGIISADLPSWRILGKPGMMENYIRIIGGQLEGIEFISLANPDFSPAIEKLVVEKGVNALIFIGATSQTAILAKSLKQMNIDTQKVTVICSISAWDESLFKTVPNEINDLYGEVHTVFPDENVPGMKIVKEVAAWAGRPPEQIVINYINGFIGAMLIENVVRNALEKHGYLKVATSGEFIRDELNNLKPFDPLWLTAPLGVVHPDQPFFYNHARIVKASTGLFIEASKWIPVDRIQGSMD